MRTEGLDSFNPFEEAGAGEPGGSAAAQQPPSYAASSATWAADSAELERRQRDLEAKAAELERREEEARKREEAARRGDSGAFLLFLSFCEILFLNARKIPIGFCLHDFIVQTLLDLCLII